MKRLFKLSVPILLLVLVSCGVPKPQLYIPQTPPATPVLPPPDVALVLGAGGNRAFAHLGVLKVLRQQHIPIDMIVGTDTGSVVAVLYAAHNNLVDTRRKLLRAAPENLLDISTLNLIEGVMNGAALQNFIVQNVKIHDLYHLRTRTVVVATDLKTGQPIALTSGPIAPAINAACALPPYLKPVRLYQHTLIDGNTTDPIPVDVAKNYHPKIIIAVNVAENLSVPMPTNIVGIYDRVYYISDRKFNHLSGQEADVVIHPNLPPLYLPTQAQKMAMIHAGEKATQQALPRICELLQKNHIASNCSTIAVPKKQAAPQRKKISAEIKQFMKKMKDRELK